MRVAVFLQQLADLALEAAHARLAGVLGDHLAQELVGDLDLLVAQPVLLQLPGPQIAPGDLDLLVGRVAVEAHDLHAVEERAGDAIGHVRRRDEEHLREVELDVQVVVAERVVLGGVEHLEERGRGVAAPVGADLVDLVQEDHGVHRLRVAERADQAAGHGADVGAAVAADLGLVAHAAQRHAHELAAGRLGNRLADRGLACAGRSDQGQDRAGAAALVLDPAFLAELADGDVLRDALLHVLEAGVVGVEHLAGANRVQDLVGGLGPRHRDHPVEVGADHRGLARALARALEAPELALGLLAGLVGHAGFLDLRPVLLDDGGVVLAKLLADRVHLLAQEVLALLVLGALGDVVVDALADLKLGQPVALDLDGQAQALGDVDRLEDAHLLVSGDVGRVADRVGQGARVADRAKERADAVIGAAELEDLLDDGAVLALEDADVLRGLVVGIGVGGDLDHERAVRVGNGGAADAAVEADKVESAPAGDAGALGDLGDRADRGELLIVACDDENLALRGPVGDDRGGHAREEDRVVEWDEGKSFHGLVLRVRERIVMNANDYRTSSFVVRLICHERH